MTAPSREEVEALIAHYDERVAQHEALKSGPAGKLRTERGEATAQVHRDTAAALRALLAQRERDEKVKVKPLEWGRAEKSGMNLQADCTFGRYYIALRSHYGWMWWRPASFPAHTGIEASEAAAKAAAQADYERRILSALAARDAGGE